MTIRSRQYETETERRERVLCSPRFGDGWLALLALSWNIVVGCLTNWATRNWQQGHKCQTNGWESCIRLSIKVGSISLPLMNYDFIYQQITKLSGCRKLNHPWKREVYDSNRKWMVIIAWNLYGFHVVEVLPKGKTFNITYSIEHILESILTLCPKSRWRRLIIHADDFRPHTIRRSQNWVARIVSESPHVHRTLPRIFLCTVWSISTCVTLLRRVLEFGFQANISLECGPFGKLNGLNWIRLCRFSKKWFSRPRP
jgi:hypothetical protein